MFPMGITGAKKVLLVDDQRLYLHLLAFILATPGLHTILAMNGKDALQQAENENPDLILLDIDLPDMDGFTVFGHLKANESTHHIPVVFLIGGNELGDKARALSMGAVDYLTKPFSMVELQNCVERVFDCMP